MAAPVFGAIGTQWQLVTNAPAFAVPAGVASGHIIILPIFVDGTTTTITSLATGFSHAPGSPLVNSAGTGGHTLNVLWKRATGADSGTYAFTMSASVYVNGAAARYTNGVATGTPIESGVATATNTASASTAPAVSTSSSGADRMFLYVATNYTGGAWTPPSGFTERLDTGDEVMTLDEKLQSTAGASGTVQGVNASSNTMSAWLGVLIGTTVASAITPVWPSRMWVPIGRSSSY